MRPGAGRSCLLKASHVLTVAPLPSVSSPPAAWREMIARHDRTVVLSLLARGIRLDRAQEIAHEAWARIYEQQALGRLERLELPGIVIAQAAFLAAQDGRRAQREGRLAPLHELPESAEWADGATSVEERLVSRQALQTARAALAECSPRSREVFTLAYEAPERPQADIARQVGLSVQRVRQILWEVRGRIRAALEESSHG
jgi:RNA polymerase sigma factor (sigma-70 family)